MKVQLVVALFLVLLVGCAREAKIEVASALVKTPTMVCGSCVKTIEKAVGQVAGVKEVAADLKTKTVKVSYEVAKVSLDQIQSAITGAGYDADGRKRDQAAYEKLDACCKIDG